eukprot:2003625-Alexandrium_andersonii.AAC.1
MLGVCCSSNSAKAPPAHPPRERTPPELQTPMLGLFLGPRSSSFERLKPLLHVPMLLEDEAPEIRTCS